MPETSLIEGLIGRLMLPLALAVNPFLAVRLLLPRLDRSAACGATALGGLILNLLAPLALHLAGIPLAPLPLAAVHAGLALLLLAGLRALHRSLLPGGGAWPSGAVGAAMVPAVLVLPVTHLGGIDAYKWADLATAVAADRRITWLVHPLSLFGFTPRSYPSLHPILMGGLRALGGLGIESSFYLASVAMIAAAAAGAHYLASVLGLSRRERVLFTAVYLLSPVFMRYVHWGTGRGAFLAVLPFFVGSLAALPRASGWGLSLVSGLLLLLSHKTGLVAVAVLPAIRVLALLYPRRLNGLSTTLLVAVLGLSVVFAPSRWLPGPPGRLAGWLVQDVVRFGWFVPAVLLTALTARRRLFAHPATASFPWLGLLITLVPAQHAEMYPAMLALPFVALAGVAAAQTLMDSRPAIAPGLLKTALVLSLCGALAIVARRSIRATPGRVYRAAMFIEQIDPWGPFIVQSNRWRTRIQGIVTGCPRFDVDVRSPGVRVSPPPPATRNPRVLVRRWADYLRGLLQLDTSTDWYRSPDRRYLVADGPHRAPPGAEALYARDGVVVYRISKDKNP